MRTVVMSIEQEVSEEAYQNAFYRYDMDQTYSYKEESNTLIFENATELIEFKQFLNKLYLKYTKYSN